MILKKVGLVQYPEVERSFYSLHSGCHEYGPPETENLRGRVFFVGMKVKVEPSVNVSFSFMTFFNDYVRRWFHVEKLNKFFLVHG